MREYPQPAKIQNTEKIVDQMKNCIYKIKSNNDKTGIAIFSFIKYRNKQIPIVITNYEIINEEYIANNNNINILRNKEINKIELGKTKYFNKESDIAIIEVKPKKNNGIYFLDLDEFLYEKDADVYFNKRSIYSIHYNKENDISVSYGVIYNIRKSEILYLNYPYLTNHCWPIFNLSSNKLIGIYNNSIGFYNRGIFCKMLFDEFIKEYRHSTINKSKKNEIEIEISVKKQDLNQKIYFLNHPSYEENEEIFELNKLNTELYIDDFNKKISYEKYFIPLKEGKHNIKLKFDHNFKDCSYMFAGCENIVKIKFISFNTKYVTNMKYMFHRCIKLKSLNLFSFDTKIVTDMSDMFSFCESLCNLDLSSFDTKNVTDMDYMFYNCPNLQNLQFITPNEEYNNIDINEPLPNFALDRNSNISDTGTNELENKYINKIKISLFVGKENINKEVYFLDNYEYVDTEGIKHNHDNLKELNNLNANIYINKYSNRKNFKKYFIPKKEGIYLILLEFKINLTDCSYMFAGCENIMKIKFISFDTKYVSNMKYMFYDCSSIQQLNLSSFITKNVNNMSNMFSGCKTLKDLNLTSFDTINVTNMSDMFSYCEDLSSMDISSFNTKNVTNICDMFSYCHNLKKINISTFETPKVTNMSGLFNCCKNLESLDLSSFNTANVNNMERMFFECHNLKSLNLYLFDTRNVTNMKAMFSGCKNLNCLNLSSFNTENVKEIDGIFYNCKKDVIENNISKFKKFVRFDMIKYD